MGFFGNLFGVKINEAAQHELSGDILLQQHHAIQNILKEIMDDLVYDTCELLYFTSFISSHIYLVAAMTAGMQQDDTHCIVEWYMKKQFPNAPEYNSAVQRHKLYMPTFHAMATDEAAYMRIAMQFMSYSTDNEYGTEAVKIGAWLSVTLHPTILKISQLLREAGRQ